VEERGGYIDLFIYELYGCKACGDKSARKGSFRMSDVWCLRVAWLVTRMKTRATGVWVARCGVCGVVCVCG